MDRLTLTLYDKNKIEYKTIKSIKDLEEIKSDKYYWLNIENIQEQDLKNLNDKFNIHPLVLEDLSNLNQRPKFEEHDEYLFFIIEIHHLLNKYFINYKNGFNSNIQRVQVGFLILKLSHTRDFNHE